ncbi:MAG TPA: putative peptide modification system cyclase [Arenimonas sp.]|uniref:putative peptide modification system cyclase n=1 Tax=Arenimonas sp. TaxID=1872635 RepID=UPI002D7F8DEB|nr:putative peptide modification system cyclase [Arenimonas sp.]HEU0153146.1 putative peptide modification system cyclase [Arenimonas sp.]
MSVPEPRVASHAYAPSVTPMLRTVLLCDIVDSTAMIERLGDVRAIALLQRHDQLMRQTLALCHGQLIDKADGALALFERPIQALDFALRYQRGLREIGAVDGVDLKARIGIHVGDVMTWANEPKDVLAGAKAFEVEGLAKPVAARLMNLARPGQILMSGMAQNLCQRAAGELGEAGARLRWLMHGRYSFKGVPAPMLVHEVGEPGLSPLRAPESGAKAWRELPLWRRPPVLALEVLVVGGLGLALFWSTFRSPPAIAFAERDWVVVADLQNRSGEPLFDDSLDTALRVGLEQSRHVNLVSDLQIDRALERMQRQGQPVDRQLATELALREGAKAVILPTVAQVGGVMRVSLEVVDPNSGVTVYSESADGRGVESVLPAMDEAIVSVRERLGESLSSIEATSAPLEKVTTANLEALRAFSMANQALGRGDARTSLTLLDRAIELDPAFASALMKKGAHYFQADDLAQARALMERAAAQQDRLSARDKLNVQAQLAIFETPDRMIDRYTQLAELYPDFMTGQQNVGNTLWQFKNDFAAAEPWYRQVAASRHPLRSLSMTTIAVMQVGQGNLDEAGRTYEDLQALGGGRLFGSDADVPLARGQHAQALAALDKDVERDSPIQRLWKGLRRSAAQADRGRYDEALAELDAIEGPQGAVNSPSDTARIALARLAVQAAAGDEAAFDKALPAYVTAQLDRVATAAERYDFSSLTHALLGGLLAARNGDTDLAREVLEKTRAMSLGSGYPEREALWKALEAELAVAGGEKDAAALAAAAKELANSHYLQAQVTRLRVLEARQDEAMMVEAGKALCAARGQALSEWSFGFSSLVPNLLATRAACDAYARTPAAGNSRRG